MTKSRFISRRALLRAMGATPIAGFAISAAAKDEIAAVAKQVCGEEHQETKFETVSRVLWSEFEEGVRIGSNLKKISPPMPIEPEVFKKAFELSGHFVVKNLDTFPDDGRDPATIACCGACGVRAVDLALTANKTSIDPTIFEEAWCATKNHFTTLFERKGSYEGTPISRRAMGCG